MKCAAPAHLAGKGPGAGTGIVQLCCVAEFPIVPGEPARD